MAGAVGFRLFALPGLLNSAADDHAFAVRAARRAARDGLLGAIFSALLLLQSMPEQALRRHVSVMEFLTSTPAVELQVGFLVLALVGFAIAIADVGFGWL